METAVLLCDAAGVPDLIEVDLEGVKLLWVRDVCRYLSLMKATKGPELQQPNSPRRLLPMIG